MGITVGISAHASPAGFWRRPLPTFSKQLQVTKTDTNINPRIHNGFCISSRNHPAAASLFMISDAARSMVASMPATTTEKQSTYAS